MIDSAVAAFIVCYGAGLRISDERHYGLERETF